jgi:hypothetical protein
MSETAVVFAALFAIGMMALGLALFVKGAREDFEIQDQAPGRARPGGWR